MNKMFEFPPQVLPESHPHYPHIQLGPRWRVIECRDGIQWILQGRNQAETVAGSDWRGRSYCRTRAALIRCCEALCGPLPNLSQIEVLPDRFPSVAPLLLNERTTR